MRKPCAHDGEMTWHLATNEDGWECEECGETLGFRPDLDRSYTYEKAASVIFWAHESKLVYVSNGEMGMIIAENLSRRAELEDTYDQYSLLKFLLEDPNFNRHAAFWRNRAERYLMGGEPIRQEQEALPF